jgi:F-type H+-transporting ATPase subunit alpha
VSVPEQIAVLLALTAELFDRVPLDHMTDAEHALLKAAADIPADVRGRLDTADKLSEEDRKAIVEIARKSLASFQPKTKPEDKAEVKPKPESKPEVKAEVKPKPEPEAKPEVKREGKPKTEPEPKPEVKADVEPKTKAEEKS